MIFMCPKCGKEEDHVDTSKAYECGDCNFPVYEGIKLVAVAEDFEAKHTPAGAKEKIEYIERIVSILTVADNILITESTPDRALAPCKKIIIEVILND